MLLLRLTFFRNSLVVLNSLTNMQYNIWIIMVRTLFGIFSAMCHFEQTTQVSSLPLTYVEHGSVPQITATG